MAAIDYLKECGFSARVANERLIVSPSSKLTPEVRQFIKLHRDELIVDLAGMPRQSPTLCTTTTQNPSLTEYPDQWPCGASTVLMTSLMWRLTRDQYINHLMACLVCHAPVGRYCTTGAELRQQYNDTPMH